MDVWDTIDAERDAFCELTDALTPDQWDTPSLCTAWKVRDVVAHVTQGATMSLGSAVLETLRYGGRINTMLEREARRRGAAPIDDLRQGLRATIGLRRTPPGTKAPDVLSDLTVHQQDARRPLGLRRTIPEAQLLACLDNAKGFTHALLPVKRYIAGLTLQASDLDWSTGSGAEVRGTAEALLMAMSGRPAALADLTGPGIDVLRSRIGR